MTNQLIKYREQIKEFIIKDEFEEARYNYYFLINKFKEHCKQDFNNYENNIKDLSSYYMEFFAISILSIQKTCKNIGDVIYKSNIILSELDRYHIDINITNEDYRILNDFYNEWSKKRYIHDKTYKEVLKEYNVIISEMSKRYQIEDTYFSFCFYEHSMIEYIRACVHLIRFKYKIDSNFSNIESSIIRGLTFYPLNYLLLKIGELNPNKSNVLNMNWMHHDIRRELIDSYSIGASNHKKKKEYQQAEKVYNWGLNNSLFGSCHGLMYNLALMYQDYVYDNNLYDCIELDLSIDNGLKALFYYKISLDENLILNDINLEFYNQQNAYFILQIYNLISVSFMRKNDNIKAIKYLNEGVEIYKKNGIYNDGHLNSIYGNLLSNRGLYLFNINEFFDSLKDLYAALHFKTKNPDGVLLNISSCYYKLEYFSDMDKVTDKVLNITNDNNIMSSALYNKILANNKLSNISNIIDSFNKYISINKNDSEIYNLIGTIFENFSKHKEAYDYYIKAYEMKNINSCYNLAFLNKDNDKFSNFFKEFIIKSKVNMKQHCSKYNCDILKEKSLYKYKTINKNTIQSLIDEYIYFSDVFSLNDPFDCRLIQEYDNDQKSKEIFNELGNPLIFSVSESQSNALMWSHYSDEHKGICIEYHFNNNKMLDNDIYIYKVNYLKKQFSSKNILLNDLRKSEGNGYIKEVLNDSILLHDIIDKDESWAYEKEYRLFNFSKNKHFNNEIYNIASITFGCLSVDDDIRTIINIYIYKAKKYQIMSNSITSDNIKISFYKLKKSNSNLRELEIDNNFNIEDYIK